MATETTNYKFIKDGSNENYDITKVNANLDKIDTALKVVDNSLVAHKAEYAIQVSTGTANAITVSTGGDFKYTQGNKLSFKAISNSTSTVTINIDGKGAKTLKKLDGNNATVKAGKVYEVYFDTTNDCFFQLARAEGDAVAGNVLAGKTFSNDDDTGIVGTMINRGTVNQVLGINGSYTIPNGYHNGLGKVTQSIPTKTAQTYTPSTSNQTIAANQYLTGAQTINGDVDLVAGNIKSGVNIFGVIGNFLAELAVGNNIIASSSLKNYARQTIPTKIKEAKVNYNGNVRVKYTFGKTTTETGTCFAQIYVNGVARGVLRSLSSWTNDVIYTEDISVNASDLVQIYVYSSNTSLSSGVKNFEISANLLPLSLITFENNAY